MTVAEFMQRMIDFSAGNIHDIDHFIKVWTYAKLIGELEGLAEEEQFVLEVSAILHDIACPLCREKHGNTNGKYQEQEGMTIAADFLKDTGLTEKQKDRVVYLVGHHHTLSGVDGMDYQMLLEADFIVNAGESGYSRDSIGSFISRTARRAVKICVSEIRQSQGWR